VTFTSAIIATGSSPLRPPIAGLESGRCVDSEGLLAQTEVPRRLVILGEASLTVHFGDGETVMADLMLVSVGCGPLVDGLEKTETSSSHPGDPGMSSTSGSGKGQ
jgi:pyruvate/2-oxoglutarate dehydrogenase complex dihydrolipoamide dehydrogenase (E3) component